MMILIDWILVEKKVLIIMEASRVRGVDDAEMQILRQKLEVPVLRCPEGRIIANICTVAGCKIRSALYCDDEGCSACKEHEDCPAIKLGRLTTLV
jgi:hypothetical protein